MMSTLLITADDITSQSWWRSSRRGGAVQFNGGPTCALPETLQGDFSLFGGSASQGWEGEQFEARNVGDLTCSHDITKKNDDSIGIWRDNYGSILGYVTNNMILGCVWKRDISPNPNMAIFMGNMLKHENWVGGAYFMIFYLVLPNVLYSQHLLMKIHKRSHRIHVLYVYGGC